MATTALSGCTTATMWGDVGASVGYPELVDGAPGATFKSSARGAAQSAWLVRYTAHTVWGKWVDVYYALPLGEDGTVAAPFAVEATPDDLRRGVAIPPDQVRAVRAARLVEVAWRPENAMPRDEERKIGCRVDRSMAGKVPVAVIVAAPRESVEGEEAVRPERKFPAPGALLLPRSQPKPSHLVASDRLDAILNTPLGLAVDAISVPVLSLVFVLDLMGLAPRC